MAEAYIVDAVRSPVGRRGGALAEIHPADLGAHSLRSLVDRTGIDPGAVDDVTSEPSMRSGDRPGTSPAPRCSSPASRSTCPA